MSAGHIDWHEDERTGLKVCVILDDAAGRILAGGEFVTTNTENSMIAVDQMVERYWWLDPRREYDHGSKFDAHRVPENGEWDGQFKIHLEKHGIKSILARVKHPQTNGKLEKWVDVCWRFGLDFDSPNSFLDWYNDRLHVSLDFDKTETPNPAFIRKMPQEAVFAIGHRLFGL
jgi:putative transposase